MIVIETYEKENKIIITDGRKYRSFPLSENLEAEMQYLTALAAFFDLDPEQAINIKEKTYDD